MLVEGAMVLESARLRDLMHLKIFVDCDEDVRFMRRLARDTDPHGAGTSLPLSLSHASVYCTPPSWYRKAGAPFLLLVQH